MLIRRSNEFLDTCPPVLSLMLRSNFLYTLSVAWVTLSVGSGSDPASQMLTSWVKK